MIKKSQIIKYFNTINNQNNLNLEEELSWGFYFSHSKKLLLDTAISHHTLNIYDFTEIVYCDDLYYLQIAKNEIHTEDSLVERCKELYIFSKDLGINFDGFDVEEIY